VDSTTRRRGGCAISYTDTSIARFQHNGRLVIYALLLRFYSSVPPEAELAVYQSRCTLTLSCYSS
jgi:hypothetical protein